jgi:hypothetical protein
MGRTAEAGEQEDDAGGLAEMALQAPAEGGGLGFLRRMMRKMT